MNREHKLNRLVFRGYGNPSLQIESEFVEMVRLDDGSVIEGLGYIHGFSHQESDWILSQPLSNFGFDNTMNLSVVLHVLFNKLRTGEIVVPTPPAEEVADDATGEV